MSLGACVRLRHVCVAPVCAVWFCMHVRSVCEEEREGIWLQGEPMHVFPRLCSLFQRVSRLFGSFPDPTGLGKESLFLPFLFGFSGFGGPLPPWRRFAHFGDDFGGILEGMRRRR